MVFTQIEFLIFFTIVLSLVYVVKVHRIQKLILLFASYYFYAYWDWRFLGIIIFSTFFDYGMGQLLKNEERSNIRKTYLILSLCVNLGILGFFKYFNFFVDSFSAILVPIGFHVQTLHLILPIGISFYTFQSLTYTIDVYKKKITPCKNFFDYALFVAFFPQLVAGPIVRASAFLPQLLEQRKLSMERLYNGFTRFTLGLFKKVFIADRLSFFVDIVFNNAGTFDIYTTWLAVLAYAVQIYCDFSGYSDMAIGLATILGYDFNENFNFPYLSKKIDEFWTRWHISLSTWLKDYLYIPLGGNRNGQARTYINLFLTMLIGGLWHGANWTFVFWGGLHGVALGMTKYFKEKFKDINFRADAINWVITLLIVLVGWVFFRSQNFHQALLMLRQMFIPQHGVSWINPYPIIGIVFLVIDHSVGLNLNKVNVYALFKVKQKYLAYATILIMWGLIYSFYPKDFQPFIYFQF